MKKFKILYIAAVASLLAACANEEDGIGNSSPVAATIQANISKTVTRATVGNTWSENDAIGVYASSGVITKEDNKKYITKNGDGTFEADGNDNVIYFKDNKETTFSAYYPYSESLTDGKMDWIMSEVEEKQPCKADVLFASGATASKASPTVKFTDAEHRFKHCMSLVKFVIKPGFGIDQAENILLGIRLNGIYKTGKFDTKTGAIVPGQYRTSFPYTFNTSFDKESSVEVIMLPQSLENDIMEIEVVLQVGDEYNTYKASLQPTTDYQFKGGYKYTYVITVNNTKITVAEANILEWETAPQGNLDAELEQ